MKHTNLRKQTKKIKWFVYVGNIKTMYNSSIVVNLDYQMGVVSRLKLYFSAYHYRVT